MTSSNLNCSFYSKLDPNFLQADFGRGQSWLMFTKSNQSSDKKYKAIITDNDFFDSRCFFEANTFGGKTLASTITTFISIPRSGIYKFRSSTNNNSAVIYSVKDNKLDLLDLNNKHSFNRGDSVLASFNFSQSRASANPFHTFLWKAYDDDKKLRFNWRNVDSRFKSLSPSAMRYKKIAEVNKNGRDTRVDLPFFVTNNPGEDLVLGPQFIRLCFDEKCSKKKALDFISNVNQDTARPTPFRESDDLFSDYRLEFPNDNWQSVVESFVNPEVLPKKVRKSFGYVSPFELRVLQDPYAEPLEYIRLMPNNFENIKRSIDLEVPSFNLFVLDSSPNLSIR